MITEQELKLLKHRLSVIKHRCKNINDNNYGGRGIKCLLSLEDLKVIWLRDEAKNINQASVDRIDNDGNYSLDNCRFISRSQNSRRKKHSNYKLHWRTKTRKLIPALKDKD